MGKVSGFILLIAALSSAQVPDFTIKGHRIGESASDFLKAEATTQAALNDCHTNAPKPVSIEEVKRRKLSSRMTKYDIEMARQGRLFDKDPEAYHGRCDPLFNIFDGGRGGELSTNYSGQDIAWQFESGKLSGLRMFGCCGRIRQRAC